MANVDSKFYLGYCRHRWVYTVRELDGELKMLALAKMPVLGYINHRFRSLLKLIHFLGRWTIMAKVERRLGIFPGGSTVDWVDRGLIGHHTELGVWWDESLPIEAILDTTPARPVWSWPICIEISSATGSSRSGSQSQEIATTASSPQRPVGRVADRCNPQALKDGWEAGLG